MKKAIIIIFSILFSLVVFLLLIFAMFPKKYRQEIEEYSNHYSLPKSYVASVINIESGYDKNAVSSSGAVGLMQLLPSTAFDCANRLNIDIDEEQLYNSEVSIKLGCFYLRYLLDLFDGNWVNTLSAYNWGYGNVRDWISYGNVDNNGTITNIPVKETRDYLKKFKVSLLVYEKLYAY